ncbi:MAG TPA: glycerol-3-phosphate 1-O-acyltransferase PlsY [Geobacteraceae bacterium]|nr:glycerol-3-phosphate 1-O-acyltransferase PlsY [Geobacteraceae bacterium]
MLKEIMFVIAAYLLGSIPTGLLLARAFGVDIRSAGSGNIGATNVYRTLGRKVGVMTLVGDCLKGLVPVLAAKYFGVSGGWIAMVGLAAFLGHVYTVFLGFKGGKGVATALGVFLGVSPATVLAALVIFSLVLWKWRYVSLASITAAAAMPVLIALAGQESFIILMSLVIAAIVIFKHRGNIERLKAGTENKFKA